MSQSHFSVEVGEYTVLTLRLSDYRPSARGMPDGFKLAVSEARPGIRAQEQKLLRTTFEDWQIPYCGNLAGWLDDSPIYALRDAELVGGLYLCARNEFNDDKHWGQFHYFFVSPEFRGKRIHSLLVKEAVRRAEAWGLEGVYINTDRSGLPEVYVRWGATILKRIRKPSRLPRNPFGNTLRWMRRRARLVWRARFGLNE